MLKFSFYLSTKQNQDKLSQVNVIRQKYDLELKIVIVDDRIWTTFVIMMLMFNNLYNLNEQNEQISLKMSKSWLGIFLFILISFIAITIIIWKKHKLMNISWQNKRRILFILGFCILLWRFINDVTLIENNTFKQHSLDYLIINKLSFYIIALWLITSKVNKFVLITPIGLFSVLSNTLNGVVNTYELINSTLLVTTIILAMIIINPQWTINKVIASFLIILLFISIPISIEITNKNVSIFKMKNIFIYSCQLLVFSNVWILFHYFYYWKIRNKTKVKFIRLVKNEFNDLLLNKRKMKELILEEYKDLESCEPPIIEEFPLLNLKKDQAIIQIQLINEFCPIFINNFFYIKLNEIFLLISLPRAPNI